MSVIIPARAIKDVSEAKSPDEAKKIITYKVGSCIDDTDVIGDMVLVGTYVRSEKIGSIFRPQTNIQEDIWQGKVGLVLKWGPDAFKNPETGQHYEQNVQVGEWCVFKVGDGWSFHLNDYPCRLVKDINIRMKIKDPTTIL